jgi:hypothetical protein
MIRIFSFALSLLLLPVAVNAAPKASVADLAWMTGSWAGPVGPGRTLEENWLVPTDGTTAALVRITGNGETSMVELIVIEEVDDSLVLYIKQWDPGFKPRTDGPQKLTLAAIGDKSVAFEAASEGGMSTLAYSNPTPGAFHIDITTSEDQSFTIKLQAR